MSFECQESKPAVCCNSCGRWMVEDVVDNLKCSQETIPEVPGNIFLKFDCPVCFSRDEISYEYFTC